MDETSNVDEDARKPDEDIIHLLNTKKQKSREILSITSAAADAVSSGAQTQTRQTSVEQYSDQNYAENKENTLSPHISRSFVSSASRDGSFNGQQRVRIPSRLLREIKSPLDRSSSGNVSSTESRNTSSGSLFASQSSSEHSSIQATGPVPTVIKYSSHPSQQPQLSPSHSQGNTNRRNDTPIVIKYLQEYKSPNSKDSSTNCSKFKKSHAESDNNSTAVPGTVSQSIPGISSERHSKDPEIVIPQSRNSQATQDSKRPDEPVKMKGAGLCQGAPSNNLSYVAESKRGQVKAVSFSLSEKGKAARDMLTKRQEHCPAVRRVVQPKIIEDEPVRGQHRSSQAEENTSKGFSGTEDKNSEKEATSQFPSGFEEQMKNLMNTLGAIESQCQENRVWQEKQQQELEQGIKQRDERRLQHLEEMQKHLMEYQLKFAQPIIAGPQHVTTTTVGSTTQGLSTTHVMSAAPTQQPLPYPNLRTSSSQIASQNLVQGVPASNPPYAPAAQHKTQPSFKTTVYSKSRDQNKKSGVKRKFVRNTRTQTSPQYSSSVSSSDTSSPLDTPLPRKRHPVPMTRDWKADRGKKHVHFDTPDDKRTGKPLEKRVDAYPIFGRPEIEHHKISEERNLEASHLHGRQRTLVAPRSPEADYIVNDISRLRQELRDALNETEQTKLSLRNLDERIHSEISSDESVVALPDHTRPYPLDAYLRATRDVPEELSAPKVEEENQTDPRAEVVPQEPGLCAYALSVLRDVQKQKENLEWNLMALSRRHDEQYLYNMAEDDETNSEALRIRKDVAKKIEEIDAVVQAELLFEEQQRALENQVSVERSKPVKQGARSTHGVPLSTEKRAKLRNVGKENAPSRTKMAVKPKVSKPPPKQPAIKRPLDDARYVSRVYGPPDHVPRRTTIKGDQTPRYQSTGAEKPKQSAAATRRKNLSPQRLDESSSTISEDYRPKTHQEKSRKPRYYFHPNAGADQSVIEAHFRENQGPLPGQLLPMAIPLGKPKMDPALRLPLYIDEEQSRQPPTVTVSSDVKQPNVAVITVKDDECLQDSGSIKKRKKSIPKEKALLTLEKQVLPNVDIDTSAFSEMSSDVSVKEIRTDEPTILPIPDPLPRPDATDYEEFKDYEHVRTLVDDQESEESSIHGEESVISLHGESRTDKPTYQGPAFPPRSIPMDVQDHLGDMRTPNETLEHKARELIEQELLARVVSEMAPPPLPDPTSVMRRTQSSGSLADSNDSEEPDLAAVIGLRGIQLFVDAGIPVDTELVRNLIMEVLQEKVSSMLGYPKPQENISPAKQEPEDDYTEPESGSEDYSRVQTPVRTPSATSQPESRPLSHVPTPEQTQSPDSLSSSIPGDVIDKNVPFVSSSHVTRDEHAEDIEEGPLDDSVHKSPIATPVATPSPPQSVMSFHTPQVSEQEKPDSEQTSPVETPEITVFTRDKTPTESPKDLEEGDLKEQTLVEDGDVEDDQETGADIPVIKFELEPEPSEAKVTNSPSSITTTTYSTQSTMGTVATDDEISEGEQLQPFVHVGQYSEGEFVAPSGVVRVENMTTLHEIPDDIFDSLNTSNKKTDLVKQAVHGLLKLDDISDESTKTSDENTSSVGQRRFPPAEPLAQSVVQQDASEGEVIRGGDVVATLLTRIRQPVRRTRPQVTEDMHDTASVGQIEERTTRDGDLSPGEFATADQKEAVTGPLSMQMLDRHQTSSFLDSDENNNDSPQSSSTNEVLNKTWDTNVMVTPKKVSVPFNRQQPYSSPAYAERSPPGNPELKTVFPRVVHVAEARHVSTPADFSPSPERRPESKGDDTMVTLSEVETSSHVGHVSDHVTDHVSDHVTPKHVSDQPARIQLTLPSADPSASNVSLISEGILESDESVGEISSISGGEV